MDENKKVVHMHIEKNVVANFKKLCVDKDVTMTRAIQDLMKKALQDNG